MDSCVSANGPKQNRNSNSTTRQIEGNLWWSASFSPWCNGSMKVVVLVEGLEVLHGPRRRGFVSPRMISILPLLNAQHTGSRDQ